MVTEIRRIQMRLFDLVDRKNENIADEKSIVNIIHTTPHI